MEKHARYYNPFFREQILVHLVAGLPTKAPTLVVQKIHLLSLVVDVNEVISSYV